MNNKDVMVYVVDLYAEICCDMCNEIIHHHFDCPICKEEYAGTSLYGEIDDDSNSFSCENCGTWFVEVNEKKLHYGWDYPLEVKIYNELHTS